MVVSNFKTAALPALLFGSGMYKELIPEVEKYGKRALLVTGGSSFEASGRLAKFLSDSQKKGIEVDHIAVSGEPSPQLVDSFVDRFRSKKIELVIAIGGGSVLDAGKAISAMLPLNESVVEYLEGVGSDKKHSGEKVPMIALPTTSGTGSEVTKNAVLSYVGPDGYKKSLRHDNFIPDLVIIDPDLLLSTPKNVTAASGLDALAQLIESYVSTNASPFTDALALDGLRHLKESLLPAYYEGGTNLEARAGMAYAAYLSGITLANAGLGVVHGIASAIGGFYNISHGVICGTLTAEAIKLNVKKLENCEDKSALQKYAKVGRIFSKKHHLGDSEAISFLIETISGWISELDIPKLGSLGVAADDLDQIIKASSNKNNPVLLSDEEISRLLLARL